MNNLLILIILVFSFNLISDNINLNMEESLTASDCVNSNYYLAYGIGPDYSDQIKAYVFKDECPWGSNTNGNPLPEKKRELAEVDTVYDDLECLAIILNEFPCACQDYERWVFRFEKTDGTILSENEIDHWGYTNWYVLGISYQGGLPLHCFYHDQWYGISFYNTFNIPCVEDDFVILKFLYFSGADNNWYLLKEWDIEIKKARDEAEVSASSSYIPNRQLLIDGKVLTKSDAEALIFNKCEGKRKDFQATIVSDRISYDIIDQSEKLTDRAGRVYGEVYTTEQNACEGKSTISVQEIEEELVKKAEIKWLPARYESTFLITCYNTPMEGEEIFKKPGKVWPSNHWDWCDYPKGDGPKNPDGTYKEYIEKFMDYVEQNGTGLSKGNEYIKYKGWVNPPCYYYDTCARTTSGICADNTRTVAVAKKIDYDPVVPFMGTVNINTDNLGQRVADDSGGDKVKGYHIDYYSGLGNTVACKSWRRIHILVDFIKY